MVDIRKASMHHLNSLLRNFVFKIPYKKNLVVYQLETTFLVTILDSELRLIKFKEEMYEGK